MDPQAEPGPTGWEVQPSLQNKSSRFSGQTHTEIADYLEVLCNFFCL